MKQTFAPFVFRNYRLYYAGQAVSLVGTWMQQVALAWLVLTLTKSGTMLGLVVAAQMLPVLLLGAYGGLIADRFDKRRLLVGTQAVLAVVSLVTGTLVLTDAIQVWMIVVLALLIGATNAVANPTRQSFVSELVDAEHLRGAISLNSVLVNAARAIGPAVAGVLIATVGLQLCFFIDAVSYIFVIAGLLLMKTELLNTPVPAQKGKGQIRDGLRYVRGIPELAVPLGMMFLIGTFAYEFQVLLPLVASDTFHGNAGTLGLLTSAQGIGAIAGGLYVARRGSTGIKAVTRGAALFGTAMLLATFAPTLHIAVVALFLVGVSSIQFLSVGNSTLQLASNPAYRGRVMALWTIAFLGSTPVGGPIIGSIAEHLSPRVGMGVGAAACLVAAGAGLAAMSRLERRSAQQLTAAA